MILITGASGMVGGPTIRELLAAGHSLRALTSSESSGAKLKQAGVSSIIVGDLRNDADVARAVEGVRCVVHIPPNIVEDEHEIGYRVVRAAEAAKVEHFIFISCYHSHPSDIPSHHNKLLVEDALYKSGLNYTVLQPSMFMQNLHMMWDTVVKTGTLAWPWSPDQQFATIDTDDLGAATAAVALEPRFYGGTYELSSYRQMSVVEMAEILSEEGGLDIKAGRLDAGIWAAHMTELGMAPWTVQNVMAMSEFYDKFGYHGGNDVVFQAITGRRANDYRSFARRFFKQAALAQ